MSTSFAAVTGLDGAPVATECLEALLAARGADRPLSRATLALVVPGTRDEVEETVVALLAAGDLAEADGRLRLTAAGIRRATSVVRKHMLAERLLHDVIGLAWSQVHRQAQNWERVISDEVEAKLVELLDDPGTCPHGNPVPGSRHRPSLQGAVPLAEADEGPMYVVRITEELEADDDALELLERAGLVPGAYGEVLPGPHRNGVRVAGSVADALVPDHIARGTYVRRA